MSTDTRGIYEIRIPMDKFSFFLFHSIEKYLFYMTNMSIFIFKIFIFDMLFIPMIE